jgi:hypothetical protein
VDKLIQEKEKEENDIFSLQKKKKKRTKKKTGGMAQAFDDSGSQKSSSTNMFQPNAFGSKPQSIKDTEHKPERILTSLERKRQDIK